MSDSGSENDVEEEQTEENEEIDEDKSKTEAEKTYAVQKKLSPYEFHGKNNPEIILTKDEAMNALKRPGFTPDGLGIAYTELDLKNKNLTNIDVATSFQHVMYLNISSNKLTNKSLMCLRLMQQLLMIRADSNQLTSTEIPKIAFLQILTLNNNNLTNISKIDHPNLGVLLLSENNIEKVENLDPNVLKNLRRLSLKKNNLSTIQGINLLSLRYLYLQYNKINSLDGVDVLQNLIVLNVAGNQIKKLDGFSSKMKLLRELYLHGNQITSISEMSRLYKVPSLRVLTTQNNPFHESSSDESDVRQEILMRVIRLDELDVKKVSSTERKLAHELRVERDYEEGSEIAEDEEEEDGDEDEEDDE